MRVCDRCGGRIPEDNGSLKLDALKKLAYYVYARYLLADKDLCIKCQKEFFEKFYPKIEALRKEVEEWLKER
jgi:hypothetical protein